MATAPQQPAPQKRPDGPAYSSPSAARNRVKTPGFLFDKTSYQWMIGGVVLIIIGFALMAGGKSPNPHEFDYSVIYSARRITVAPIIILLGFALEVYAIMKKPVQPEEPREPGV